MATKIKTDLIFQYNILPIYFDDDTKTDNVLSDFDFSDLMVMLNDKKVFAEEIAFVSLDLILNRVSIFSELFPIDSQKVETWFFADLTAGEQTIINDFINGL